VDLARSLGIYEGDTVTLVAPESLLLPSGEIPVYEKAVVKALVRTDVPEVDGHVVFFDVDKGLHRLDETASMEKGLEIRLNNPESAPDLAEKMVKLTTGKVKTWRDMDAALFYSLKMEKTLMGVFLGLTVLVASFSIMSVLVLLVTEKRTDVGILKALGATRNTVRRIFTLIGLTLGVVGILGGTVLGLIICWVIVRYPIIHLPDIYYDTSFPVKVEPITIGMIVILGLLLTLAGTFVPAWRVASFDPMAAIRRSED
jgi:lipoprotein-releasing system permease protein